jgi:hypothetical protein
MVKEWNIQMYLMNTLHARCTSDISQTEIWFQIRLNLYQIEVLKLSKLIHWDKAGNLKSNHSPKDKILLKASIRDSPSLIPENGLPILIHYSQTITHLVFEICTVPLFVQCLRSKLMAVGCSHTNLFNTNRFFLLRKKCWIKVTLEPRTPWEFLLAIEIF